MLSEYYYLIPFFITTFIFGFVPGPSIMYTLAQTVTKGKRGGLIAALGIHIGCFVHIIAAALGLSAIFNLVPELYLVVKFAGAAYLVYLGVRMIMSKTNGSIPVEHITSLQKTTLFNSMLVEILNPKTAIFFIAFLPQFIDVNASLSVWLQFLILGQFINMVFSTADLIYIFIAESIVNKLKNNNLNSRILQWFGGTMLIILAGHLILDE
ncbi:MAG: LysE family translocator [Rhizobiales bacterium]|nr:LysE family translocator [Hyphomicrobiales bacterium]